LIDVDTIQAAAHLQRAAAAIQDTTFADDHDAYHDICDEPDYDGDDGSRDSHE